MVGMQARFRRRSVAVMLLLAGALVVPASGQLARPGAAASPASGAAGVPARRARVIIGDLAIAGNAGLYAAAEGGYFERQGIDPSFQVLDSAAQATIALGTGNMHVVGGGISVGLFNAVGRGVEIEVVADKGKMAVRDGRDHSYMRLAVRRDLYEQGVRSVADLKGRIIAVNALGSPSEFQVAQMLHKGGLEVADVRLVELPFPDMPAAMQNRSIDAAAVLEPFATVAKERGFAEWIFSTAQAYPDYQAGVILYSGKWARENPDVARRVMVAYLQGVRDYETARRRGPGSPEFGRMAGIISKYAFVKPEDIGRIVWPFIEPTGRLNLGSIRDELQWYVGRGLVRTPVELARLINMSYVDYANQLLGEYQPPR